MSFCSRGKIKDCKTFWRKETCEGIILKRIFTKQGWESVEWSGVI
jgi:hypothetical protein